MRRIPRSRWIPALLACALLAGPVVSAQEDTARKVLEAWIQEVNDASAEELQSYVEESFTASFLQQVPLDQLLAFHRQVQAGGTIRLEYVESSSDEEVVALLHTAADTWLRARLRVSGEPPRIAGLLVRPAQAPDAEPLRWETLDDLAARLARDGDIPGVAVAWARPGRELHVGVAGLRAAGADTPVRADDRFHLGSLTKSITASAVGRLVEVGSLRWDATLGELLPDVEMRSEYADVKLQQLLRHRAGVPQHLIMDDEEMARLNGLPGTLTEQRAAYAAEVLMEEPLDRNFHYSNAGYAIVSAIAENASGRSWEELVVEEVFEPLGLDSCGIGWPASDTRPDQPRGHFGPRGARVVQRLDQYVLGAFIAPAGNTHCSVADLTRYGLAHLRGLQGENGFLKAETIRELHRVSEPAAPYAAGWGVDPHSGQHRHNGSAGTFFSYLVLDPRSGVVVAFLANAGPTDGQPAAVRAVEAVLERTGNQP